MDTKRRSNLAGGLILIVLGAAFLLAQVYPMFFNWLDPSHNWPLIVIGVGLFMLVIGLLTGVPAMAVPACIIGGIGGLLYWQNYTGNWESWSYVWTLIPGFVGVGIIVSGLLSGQGRKALREGSGTILVSVVLFAIFGFLLGGTDLSGLAWPILLIGVGVIVLVRSLFRLR